LRSVFYALKIFRKKERVQNKRIKKEKKRNRERIKKKE